MIAIENHVKPGIYFPFNPEPMSIDRIEILSEYSNIC
jgi:hypothetical protein